MRLRPREAQSFGHCSAHIRKASNPMRRETGDPTPARAGATRLIRPALGIVISLGFVYLAVRNLSWPQIRDALASVDLRYAPVALACLAIGYAARITRWWMMLLPARSTLLWREAASPFLISIAANNVLPFRMGDIMRLFAFRGQVGLEASRVAGTLLVERLLDLFALLTIFVLVLPFVPTSESGERIALLARWAAACGGIAIVTLILVAVLERLVVRRLAADPRVQAIPLAPKVLAIVTTLSDTLRAIGRPSRILALCLLSAAAWLGEGGVFVVAAHAASVPLDLAGAFFSLAVATLSTLLPSSPGYVGTFHFFAMQAALAFGAQPAAAAAFAIVVHLALWAPTTLAGLLAFLARGAGRQRDWSDGLHPSKTDTSAL
jgi:glycosyltransferase 2 family protein